MRNHPTTSSLGKISITLVLTLLLTIPITASEPITTITPSSPHHTTEINATVYVNGNNTHGPWNGTINYPYQFIQQGIDNAPEFGTVFVFHGTYHELIAINKLHINVTGERRNDTIIDGSGFDTVVRITSDFCAITNFTIEHSGNQSNDAGVTLNAHNCTVTKNNITQNFFGVYATTAGNHVFFNTIYNNSHQAYTTMNNSWDNGVAGNFWSDLPKVDANENGIIDTPYNITGSASQDHYPLLHPYGSIVNRQTNMEFLTINQAIMDNTTGDGNLITVAPDLYWEHIIVNKKVMLIGQDRNATTLDGSYYGTVIRLIAPEIILQGFTIQNSGTAEFDAGVSVEQQYAFVTNDLIQNNHHGVFFKVNGSNCLLYQSTIRTNTWNGVYILETTGEQVIENTIQDNGFAGIMIFDASYNTVFHNTMLNNRLQAFDNGFNIWDNGYPSGGNRWSDYTGTDANHDGIGDTPYTIPGGTGVDRYPLMKGYQGNDTMPPILNIIAPVNGLYIRGHQVLKHFFNRRVIALGPITITVNASDLQSGIRDVRFFLDENSTPLATLTAPPFTFTWGRLTPLKHAHTITIVATDNAGNWVQDFVVIHHWI